MPLKVKSPRYFSALYYPSLYISETYTKKNIADYSVILQKPMFEIKVLQLLQGQFLGFHLRIPLLKFPSELVYLSFKGSTDPTQSVQNTCLK